MATRCISRRASEGEFYIEPVIAFICLYAVLKLGSKQKRTNAHDRKYHVVFIRYYDNRT